MPANSKTGRMEKHLKDAARKKGLKGKRARAFVYGTMRKHGWKPGGKIKSKKKKKKGLKKSYGGGVIA